KKRQYCYVRNHSLAKPMLRFLRYALCPIFRNNLYLNGQLTQEIYIFSGLGADERVFQQLDFSNFRTTFVEWIVPQDPDTIEQYATRLLDQINSTKPVLIGLSFGGLIAVEVAKQIDTQQVIIIASAKTRHEIPFYYRIAGRLGLHKLL